MRLPYAASVARKTKEQIIAFGGVNYGLRPKDGELMESMGLCSARYPCLSQRDGRKTAGTYAAPTGLYARGKLCVVDGTDFIYGGKVAGQVSAGEKQFATINTKIVIFPDKVYYDTEKDKFEALGCKYAGCAGHVTFTANTLTVPERGWFDLEAEEDRTVADVPADASITVYTGAGVNKSTGALTMSGGAAKPVTPDALEAGDHIQYGLEDAKEYMIVKSSEEQLDGSWRISGRLHTATLHEYQVFDGLFKEGDAIEISGCTTSPNNNGSHIIRGVSGRTLTFSEDIFSQTGTEAGTVLLERRVPELTCICECDNRIWGAEGTTIYASALGDPTNFFVYDGLSTDSYAAAVGSDGEFTGCCAYSSTVLFWKENCMHKVLGSYPAQYEIYTYTVPGIQKGSEKSMCIINETLFYKGRGGVYAYSGGTPELISESFGTRRFRDAVAGTDGERYYVSMQTERGAWELYVFDTLRGDLAEGGRHPRGGLRVSGRDTVLPRRREREADNDRAGQQRGGAGEVERDTLPDGRDYPRAQGLLQAVPARGHGGRGVAQGGDKHGRQTVPAGVLHAQRARQDDADTHTAGALRQLPHTAVQQGRVHHQEPGARVRRGQRILSALF